MARKPKLPYIVLRFSFKIESNVKGSSMGSRIFSFTVPVQSPLLETVPGGEGAASLRSNHYSRGEGQLRAVEGGVPCYRGSNGGESHIYQLSPRRNARTLAPRGEAQVVATSLSAHLQKVSEMQRSVWNVTRKHGLSEPWKSPVIFDELDDEQASNPPAENVSARQLVEAALQEFINVTDTSAKILLVDHVPYGWDLTALRDAVAKLIEEETGASDDSEKICETLVNYEPMDHWIRLRVLDRGTPHVRSAYGQAVFGALTYDGQSLWSILGPLLFVWSLFFIHDSERRLGIVSVGCLPLFCLLVLCATTCARITPAKRIASTTRPKRVALFDTVMLAHPLTQWQQTDIPLSIGKQDAFDQLQERESTIDSAKVKLEQRNEGWYVLRGSREADWLADHREILLKAIKRRADGDLTLDIISRQHR